MLPHPKNPNAQGDLYRLVLFSALNHAPPIAALSGEKKVKLSAYKQLTVNAKPRGDLSRRGHLWLSAAYAVCAAFCIGRDLSAAYRRSERREKGAKPSAVRWRLGAPAKRSFVGKRRRSGVNERRRNHLKHRRRE